MLKGLRNSFVSGLLVLAPLVVTIFVIDFLVSQVGAPMRGLLFPFIPPDTSKIWGEYILYILSTFIVFVLIAVLGWMSKKVIGRMLVQSLERLVQRLPGVSGLYNTVKQIRDTFVQQEKAVFQKTVLIEYPRQGVYAIGFLTGDGKGEVQERTSADLINVFLPTTPNPTSGYLLMVPREQVMLLDMSIADGMKVIISGGALVPPYPVSRISDGRLPATETLP